MNKYEIKIVLLSGLLLCSFLFALLYNAFSRKVDVPACIPYNVAFEKGHVRQLDDSTYEVYVSAHMWAFDPAEIVIPVGSTVEFYLTSTDVVHGFNIDGKGVNLMAVPGGVNRITVPFNSIGTYRIVCHEFCGIGHQNMMGKIIVKDKIYQQ